MIKCLNKFGDELYPLDFIELQWNRKYFEAGNFVLYMAAKDYNPDVKYIQILGRPETGIIQKVVYEEKSNGEFVTLSGFFIEKLLDSAAYTETRIWDASDISNVSPEKLVEILGLFLYTLFWQQTDTLQQSLDLSIPGSHLDQYNTTLFYETLIKNGIGLSHPMMTFDIGEPFGRSLFKNLEKCNASYNVKPRFANRDESKPLLGIELKAWQGRDLRNKIFFGDIIENVKKIEYMHDDSAAKTDIVALQVIPDNITNYSNTGHVYKDAKWQKCIYESYSYEPNQPTDLGKISPRKVIETNCNDITASNESKIRAQMKHAAQLELLNNYKQEKISVYAIQNKFYYLKDYDLGDICSIVIDKIQKMYTARIIEVNEVFSKNTSQVELVLGTPTKQKYRRII